MPFTLTRTRVLALVLGAIAVALLAGRLFRSAPPRGTAPPILTASAPAARAAPPARLLVVDVAGAVRRPGLYRLARGSRIQNAIVQAGGPTRHAELDLVNLAAPLADGEQVLVPTRGAAGVGAAGGPPSPTAPLDLNSATADQLDALPGIGPVTAQKIIDYRQAHGPFTSVDDLASIPGIGPSHIANLKGLVVP